ncbi:MAG: hypothetical protein K9M45_10570 [Kiritimatiellales bacterium]|nr:hypothetical protein [Kiritimatiellales bacterium]
MTAIVFCAIIHSNSHGADREGLDVKHPLRFIPEKDIRLLIDKTSYDQRTEHRIINQQIFDGVLHQIQQAESFIVLDFFLWNAWTGDMESDAICRKISSELAKALVAKKEQQPSIRIICLTDPINRIYEKDDPEFYQDLIGAGISIVFTDLSKLPDSNKIYSWPMKPLGFVFKFFKWADGRYLANPFDKEPEKVSIAQASRLFHFKANHRKVIISDSDGIACVTVSSFNPADGSSAHSNVGLQLRGSIALDALDSELKCIQWSAKKKRGLLAPDKEYFEEAWSFVWQKLVDFQRAITADILSDPEAQWLTEGCIRDKIVELFNHAGEGDHARISMFYLSDYEVIKSISNAGGRGVKIDLILDPNRDAFGREKKGIPNRPVAALLLAKSERDNIRIRWADTHGEQFHLKAASITNPEKAKYEFICGSANWTRRNIGNYNMEANIYIRNAIKVVSAYNAFFENAWNNSDGLSHTLEYERYSMSGAALWWKKTLYYVQETTGFCTF